jgi:hypothetical protein
MPDNYPVTPGAKRRFDTKLTVVIPAYNEGRLIRRTLAVVSETLASFCEDYAIIVVNDGSTDDTQAQLGLAMRERACVSSVLSEKKLGQGQRAQAGRGGRAKRGVRRLSGRGPGPASPPPDRILRNSATRHADAVIGSKLHPDSKLSYPKSRRVISFCYFLALKILFGLNVHDTQTGIKLFRAESIKRVMPAIRVKRFAYDIEVLSLFNRLKLKISEAPVELNFQRESGWSRIRLKDVLRVGWDTFAVFCRLRILKYYDPILRDAAPAADPERPARQAPPRNGGPRRKT